MKSPASFPASDQAAFFLSKFNELKWNKMAQNNSPLATSFKNCQKKKKAAGSSGEGEKKSEQPSFSTDLLCLFTALWKTTHPNRLFFKYKDEFKSIFLLAKPYTEMFGISRTQTVVLCPWYAIPIFKCCNRKPNLFRAFPL